MTKEALQEILHVLELDYEAEPTLAYVFYVLPDGRMGNFSLAIRQGEKMTDEQMVALMRREYPATRQGEVIAVERPEGATATEWLDITEVCQMLHISRKTLWKWTRKGLLKPSKVNNGRVYYDRRQIDRMIRANAIDENGRLDKTANGFF